MINAVQTGQHDPSGEALPATAVPRADLPLNLNIFNILKMYTKMYCN